MSTTLLLPLFSENVMLGRSTSSVAFPVDAVGIRESQLQMTATAVASAESRATCRIRFMGEFGRS